MRLAMVAAKFTDVEANQLRRAMATFRHVGTIGKFEALMVERMVARGYERDFARVVSSRSRGSAVTVFPKVMPRLLRGLFMFPHGSNVFIPPYSPARC